MEVDNMIVKGQYHLMRPDRNIHQNLLKFKLYHESTGLKENSEKEKKGFKYQILDSQYQN